MKCRERAARRSPTVSFGVPAACVWVVLAAVVVSGDDRAGDAAYNWEHPEQVRLTDEETAFTSERLGGTKNESVHVWAYDPSGPLLAFSLFHVDTLLFDRWGSYALVLSPAGRSYWHTDIAESQEVSFAEERLSVAHGETSFSCQSGIGLLNVAMGDLSCRLVFSSRLTGWKPGTGRVDYTEDGGLYQRRMLVIPWGHASGTVTVPGESFTFDGHGYVSKTRFSNPLHRFAPEIHALRLYAEDDFLCLLDVTLHAAYDNRKVPMILYAHDDEWVFTSEEYELSVVDHGSADDVPYRYPTVLSITYDDGRHKLEGVYREERFVMLTDVFEEIPSFVRDMLLLVLSRPVYFRSVGTFEGTVTGPDGEVRRLSLSGPYEYTVVQ